MTTQPEARISRAILTTLKKEGVFAFKVHGGPTQLAGLPDILACVDGVYIGLEVKLPSTRTNTSARQDYVHDLIRQSGGIAEVVCSAREAMEIITKVRLARRRARIPKSFWNRSL